MKGAETVNLPSFMSILVGFDEALSLIEVSGNGGARERGVGYKCSGHRNYC